MFDELPVVQFSEVITARGNIHAEGEVIPASRFRLSRAKHDVRSPWEFEIFFEEDSRALFDKVIKGRSFPRFLGTTFSGHSIEVPRLRWRRWTIGSGTLIGVVWELLIDPDTLPTKPSRQMVNVSLSPTTLALPQKPFLVRSYTGEIKEEPEGSTVVEKLLFWESAHGRVTLAEYFNYERARVGESDSLVQIPVSSLRLELKEEAVTTEPRGLADAVAKEIAGPLRLLSYLSRSHVRWSAIRVSSVYQDADSRPRMHEMQLLRAGVLGEDKRNREWGLANAHNMAPDGLNTMVVALRDSPYREVLETAMVYLVTGHDTRIAESSLITSFTALETITNGIGRVDKTDEILKESQFRKLRRQVEATIRNHAKDQSLLAELLPSIIAKLPELNRAPIATRVCALVERYKVDWKDLWPDEPLEDGLKRTFKVRNDFVHTGHMDMTGRAFIAARRAHILGERIVWKMLGGIWQWEDVSSYSDTDRLVAQERELDKEDGASSSDFSAGTSDESSPAE